MVLEELCHSSHSRPPRGALGTCLQPCLVRSGVTCGAGGGGVTRPQELPASGRLGALPTLLPAHCVSGTAGYRITESQNSRNWKGSLELIQSNTSAKTDFLQQVTQESIQVCLEYFQEIHNLSDQLIRVLCCSQIKVFPQVCMKLPMFQFAPVAPCPITGHH